MGLALADIDSAAYRRAVGTFASGVAVISTHDETGTPVGMTATSFTAVSFDPPSVLVCVRRESRTRDHIAEQRSFGISLLGTDGRDISDHCAVPLQDKGLPAGWLDHRAGWQSPALNAALAFFDCRVEQLLEAGTHTVFLGQVMGIGLAQDRTHTDPLMHFRGAYRHLDRHLTAAEVAPLPIVAHDFFASEVF